MPRTGKHKTCNRYKDCEKGFTMVAVLSLLVSSVVLAAGTVASYNASRPLEIAKNTADRLKEIEDALIVYQASHGFLLPCPADASAGDGLSRADCITTAGDEIGVVPWRELGLKKTDVIDGFGRYITYTVTPGLTDGSATEGDLEVLDGVSSTVDLCDAGNGEHCAFVLVSHGRNGLGALLPSGLASPSKTLEIENTSRNDSGYSSAVFRRAPLNEDEASNDYFDDSLVWGRLKDSGA